MDWQERSRRLLGEENLLKLNKSRVLICGLGGVGAVIAESLVRSGLGALDLLDYDIINLSNINRQLPATTKTLNQYKTNALAERLLDINPQVSIKKYYDKLSPEHMDWLFENGTYDYIADAIDDVPAKLALIQAAFGRNIPILSSMGAGFRLNPSHLKITDISKTHTCPLARKVRKALKKVRISKGVDVVWSDELPIKPLHPGQGPASMMFVPASAGLMMASFITQKIIAERTDSL